MDGTRIPSFARDAQLQPGQDGRGWALQTMGERILPNEIAVEILRLVDGGRNIDGIIEVLELRYAAPRERIRRDVFAVVDDLAARGALQLREQPSWKMSLSMFTTWLKLLFRRRNHV